MILFSFVWLLFYTLIVARAGHRQERRSHSRTSLVARRWLGTRGNSRPTHHSGSQETRRPGGDKERTIEGHSEDEIRPNKQMPDGSLSSSEWNLGQGEKSCRCECINFTDKWAATQSQLSSLRVQQGPVFQPESHHPVEFFLYNPKVTFCIFLNFFSSPGMPLPLESQQLLFCVMVTFRAWNVNSSTDN